MWPAHVSLITSRDGQEAVPYQELLSDHYSGCAASLIILKDDPVQYTGVGMTNLIEAMAMSRPVIVTRTGALPTELDVEMAGCGLFVPPRDPGALAAALDFVADDPARALRMGNAGRRLCESHYNMVRYANQLHEFFNSL
jgi:glycosyltransferase involved in cell wall biosynthesis